MLNVMRDNLRHLKWVLIIVSVSMLAYLGAYFDLRGGKGASADWAAKVDGDSISTEAFIKEARQRDDYYRRLLGDQYETLKKNIKIGSIAIQNLVQRKLVLSEARAMGLTATPEEVSHEILTSPSFKDASGHFVGKDRYTAYLDQTYDGGVTAFERGLADDIVARKWFGVVTASAQVTDADVERAWRDAHVHVAYDYVFVPVTAVSFDTNVTDAQASAWYAAHKDDYKRPESRRVKILTVDRQAEASKVQVSDGDVRAYYDAHKADFERPEQRHARHILLKLPPGAGEADKRSVRELAESILARVKKGEDFAALAKSMSQDPGSASKGGDLGWFGRGQMVKPFEDAVFNTPPGQFAPVVETPYGFHVIEVLGERPAGTAPFDDVKDAIRRRLTLQKAQDAALAKATTLRGEIKTAADIDAVAAKAGLKLDERLISADSALGAIGPSPEFQTAVAALPAGGVTQPVGVARGVALVACTAVLPPGIEPLSEALTRVKTDVLNERGRQAALVAARRIAAGSSLEAGAKGFKLDVKKSGDVSPGTPVPGAGALPALDAILFDAKTEVGAKGAVVAPGGAVAYDVTKHDAFDPAKFQADKAALEEQLLKQRRNELAQGIVETLLRKHDVKINQAVVDSLNS